MTVGTTAKVTAEELTRRCEGALVAYLDRQHPLWPQGTPQGLLDAVRRFVLAGGKRLRPQFCYWGWRGAGGPDRPEIITAASSLELFQAFALIHDDIMDGSERRRGRPSIHRHFADLHVQRCWRGDPARYGQSAALLAGDLCAAWADQMYAASGLPPAWLQRGHRIFSLMRTEVIAGQYLDLVSAASDGSVAGALTVIRMKAARYTVTRPLQLGAILTGAGPEALAALLEFGDPLGDAFQLRDDVLGVFGDPSITGKPVLDDLREGKPTVLIALARARAEPAARMRLENLFGRSDLDFDDARQLRAIIAATGAQSRVEDMITERAGSAVAALARAPIVEEARAALATLAREVVVRDH